jgi:hypothetical protein
MKPLAFILGLLVWLICIICVAIDSGQKRISPVFWSLATVLSGPLGLVAYGIVRELTAKKNSSN